MRESKIEYFIFKYWPKINLLIFLTPAVIPNAVRNLPKR
jgi:hypothetical protein